MLSICQLQLERQRLGRGIVVRVVLVLADDHLGFVGLVVPPAVRALTGPDPHWPEGTRHVSELRLSLRVQPRGLLGGLRGTQTLHLDIVDYPGEWLLDLALIGQDYASWSAQAVADARKAHRLAIAAPWLEDLPQRDPAGPADELAEALARTPGAHVERVEDTWVVDLRGVG